MGLLATTSYLLPITPNLLTAGALHCIINISSLQQGATTMSIQHQQLVTAYETYIAENEKFTTKGVKAAAARARKALQEMSKCIKERRKEITAEKEALATTAK